MPVVGVGVRPTGDTDGQLDLDGVGVLELVQQQPLVVVVKVATRTGTGAQQLPSQYQQVVELEPALVPSALSGCDNVGCEPMGQPAKTLLAYGVDQGLRLGGEILRSSAHRLDGLRPVALLSMAEGQVGNLVQDPQLGLDVRGSGQPVKAFAEIAEPEEQLVI